MFGWEGAGVNFGDLEPPSCIGAARRVKVESLIQFTKGTCLKGKRHTKLRPGGV